MVRHGKEEVGQRNYGKTVFKKPISSSNKVGFSAVRTRDGMNLVCSSEPKGPGEEGTASVSLESLSRPAGSQVTTGDAVPAVV